MTLFKSGIRLFSIVALCFGSGLDGPVARATATQQLQQHMMWRLDLANLGMVESDQMRGSNALFLGDDLSVATFWTRDDAGPKLHAAVIDAHTGELRSTREWNQETRSFFELLPAAESGFIIRLGPRTDGPRTESPTPRMKLILIGSDLEVKREVEFAGRTGHFWKTVASASNKSLFVRSSDATADPAHPGRRLVDQDIIAFRTKDQTQIGKWRDNDADWSSASDTFAVRDWESRNMPSLPGFPVRILVAEVGTAQWRPLFSPDSYVSATALNDNAIIMCGRKIELMDKQGGLLFSDEPLRWSEVVYRVIPAANGKAFAVVVTEYKRPGLLADYKIATKARLLLYDCIARKRVGSVDLKSRVQALSSDGRRLLYSNGTFIEAYEIVD